jgi:hypothetical protein
MYHSDMLSHQNKNTMLRTVPDGVSTFLPLLSRREAAAHLSVSVQMIDKLRRLGQLSCIYVGRTVRFRQIEDLKRFMDAQVRKTVARNRKSRKTGEPHTDANQPG